MTSRSNFDGEHRQGPYGTNVGDVWLGSGEIQELLEDGLQLVCEVIVRDGRKQEVVYVTEDEELIARAKKGHERFVAEVANRN